MVQEPSGDKSSPVASMSLLNIQRIPDGKLYAVAVSKPIYNKPQIRMERAAQVDIMQRCYDRLYDTPYDLSLRQGPGNGTSTLLSTADKHRKLIGQALKKYEQATLSM